MKRSTVLRAMMGLVLGYLVLGGSAWAQGGSNLAPGFTDRSKASRLIVMPVDVELFSISGGGVPEPKADWTLAAAGHIKTSLDARKETLGAQVTSLLEKDVDDISDLNALHGAVAQSVFLHHSPGIFKLPTKNNVLDWSLGDAVKPLKEKTGADYGLFIWIRDSYASAERKAAMVMLALVGVGVGGGAQTGYASLVDLSNGRVVWFNHLQRGSGDLREAAAAHETVEALLKGFPVAR